MSGATTAIVATAAVVGAGAAVYSGQQQAKAADKAGKQAQANADAAAKQADQANNAANGKSPNTQNLLDQNVQAALGGASGTMLTGAQGVDPNSLALGKNTLLGQ